MKLQEGEADVPRNVSEMSQERKWKRIAYLSLFSLAMLFIAYSIYTYIGYTSVVELSKDLSKQIDDKFMWMLLVGFCFGLWDSLGLYSLQRARTVTRTVAGPRPAARAFLELFLFLVLANAGPPPAARVLFWEHQPI